MKAPNGLMRALVREQGAVRLRGLPRPALRRADEALIRLAVAGICRTDLHAADGTLTCAEPVVLGHEAAGTVAEAGGACGFAAGERVTIVPSAPCGRCASCARPGLTAEEARCDATRFLGVDADGLFRDYAVVPAFLLRRLPAGLSFAHGAYAEPLAAALAVAGAGLDPAQRGLVHGGGRIAILTRRVLAARGFRFVEACADPEPRPDSYDFAVETVPTAQGLRAALTAVRPGGTVVLKSRPPAPVPLDLRLAVEKRLVLRGARWAPFADALTLLAERRVAIDDLLGPLHPLEDFAAAFAAARASESRKQFLALAGEPA